jgi:glycosyltransferase involved in cell wall biosynthesis
MINEAMAVGTPIVTSSVAGIPEVLDHGRCGVLVPPKDAKGLADAIARLLANEALRRKFAVQPGNMSRKSSTCGAVGYVERISFVR